MMHGFWDMVCDKWLLFLILGYFLPFYATNSPKNQNFEKMKNTPGEIIILHKCTTNYDQIMYDSWDMVCEGCNYFSFWAIFCPFNLPSNSPKNPKKNLKKKKNAWRHHLLHKYTKNHDRMPYCSEMWCVTDVIVIVHFGLFFALLPP